jgi:hypothetical protein
MMRVATILLLLGLAFAPRPALTHGAADWIRTNPATAYCCGPTDCAPLPDNQVIETRDGWLVLPDRQAFSRTDPNVFPSNDNHYWACRPPGEPYHCFFYPNLSS